MAMHTRRELLRTSLLAGGALCTPQIWAQVSTGTRTFVAGRWAVAVAGGIAGIESYQILIQPAPPPGRAFAPVLPAPAATARAPATAPASTGALTAIKPGVNRLSVANQARPAWQFSFSSAWDHISAPIANWVVGAVNHAPSLQNGSFYGCDYNGIILSQEDWTGGVVSQVTWPGCEVTSIARAFPVITVDAATMTWRKPSGSLFNVLKVAPPDKYWRACDFVVSSSVNINASRIASVSPLTLVPAVYGGIVTLGYNVAAAGPTVLDPFQAAVQAGGLPMPGLSTDLVIHYGRAVPGVSITLHNCRVLSVNSALPRSVVNMSYADASLTT